MEEVCRAAERHGVGMITSRAKRHNSVALSVPPHVLHVKNTDAPSNECRMGRRHHSPEHPAPSHHYEHSIPA
jgi:hypothetical protein